MLCVHPNSKPVSRAGLPDRLARHHHSRPVLRVLLPNDPESYYRSREITPPDMLRDVQSAKIVITNYHAFKLFARKAG